MFLGDAGSSRATFLRALERRNAMVAWSCAHELGRLSLPEALELVVLLAEAGHARFEPAAVRLLGRLLTEARGLGLADVQLAAGAIGKLGSADASLAATVLRTLVTRQENSRASHAAQ
jgi:hypothetical protein